MEANRRLLSGIRWLPLFTRKGLKIWYEFWHDDFELLFFVENRFSYFDFIDSFAIIAKITKFWFCLRSSTRNLLDFFSVWAPSSFTCSLFFFSQISNKRIKIVKNFIFSEFTNSLAAKSRKSPKHQASSRPSKRRAPPRCCDSAIQHWMLNSFFFILFPFLVEILKIITCLTC